MGNVAEDRDTTPIWGILPKHVVKVWPKVESILRRVVTPQTGFDLDHVLTELQCQHWQLWTIDNYRAVVITRIEKRPLGNVLWVQYLAGDGMNKWLDDWVTVQDTYAKHNGCVATEFQSPRDGWLKINERYPDYTPTCTIFRKDYET